jgi:septal ring factor EnvC (AmiA/AmiB activator)
MIRRLTVIVLLASLLPPCVCATGSGENPQTRTLSIGKLKREVRPLQETDPQTNAIDIGKLRQEISSHQEKIEQSRKEEYSLLDELAALDKKIGAQKAKVDTLQTRLREQEQVIATKEKELATISRKNEALRQHLIKRLRSFYLLGRTGFLNIAFSNKTLPDLLLANDAYYSLVTYDQAVFAEYRKSVIDIDQAKRAHELEKTMQEHFLVDADKENSLLQQVAEQKNAVLKRIQTEKSLYEQALREIKKAESNLLNTLTKPSQVTEQKSHGFAASRKKLPPPVWGKLTSRFHDPAATDEDSPFANGITVLTSDQAEVFAVYGGVVIFAGYMSGYGKMVIIEHDQQYYTVTARFDEIQVQEGDSVKQGQIIGTTGETATLFGKGLYFEIRHGAQPENPLDWIQPGTLTIR